MSRTERTDYQATSDPALQAAADRGEASLLGYVAGFTLVARDEHRHVAFGARFLRDMVERDPRHADAIQRTLAEVAPAADGVLRPKWFEGTEDEPTLFGVSVRETMRALERRLNVIGLLATA